MPNKNLSLTIENLSFSYDKKEVFNNLNLCFPAGTCSAIMAKSGRGKTTLLYLIAGLLKAQAGKIIYPVNKPSFSFVFQENRLVEQTTVANNLRMIKPTLTNAQLYEHLSQIGLLDKKYMHQKISQLSGGEQRRIAILRALLAEYDILLLDEPFSGLDKNTKQRMMNYVKASTVGKTVLLVTHDSYEAEFMSGGAAYTTPTNFNPQ